MWRHIPKIVVLAAIGLLVLMFYVTQRNPAPPSPTAARGNAPSVIYVNPGFRDRR